MSLTSTTTVSPSKNGSNGNKEVLHIHQIMSLTIRSSLM